VLVSQESSDMNQTSFSAVEQQIDLEMARGGVPSFAVMLWHQGQVVWSIARGWADRASGRPADLNSPYLLASVTKPITATAVCVLAQQGKLDLDAPINEYLAPGARLSVWIGEDRDVTIRRVCAHAAGLPLHSRGLNAGEPRHMPEVVHRYGNVVFPPGERYCYSNIGYGILDHLIERVSGRSYNDFVRSEVFQPLGMTRSYIGGDAHPSPATCTLYNEDGTIQPPYDTDHRGATLAYCSAQDLLRFGQFHLAGPQRDQAAILSDALRLEMQKPAVSMNLGTTADPNLKPGSGYGLGWVIDHDDVELRVSHAGGYGGCATKIILLPRDGVVLVTMANMFCHLPYRIEEQILPALLPDYGQRLERQRAARASAPPPEQDTRPITDLRGEWRGRVHTYQGDLDLVFQVKDSGDIHARLGDQLWTLVNDAALRGNRFTGRMQGSVGTDDAHQRPRHAFHHLRLDLVLRQDRLCGVMIAVVARELGHWVDLRKCPT
jgi:CubicO group peptidase (beta-lactamase class C family)